MRTLSTEEWTANAATGTDASKIAEAISPSVFGPDKTAQPLTTGKHSAVDAELPNRLETRRFSIRAKPLWEERTL